MPTARATSRLGSRPGTCSGARGRTSATRSSLAERARDRLALGANESADDALAVIGEVAMKRAALFGRAPVMTDIDIAASLLGYKGEVDPAFVQWRTHAVQGAKHEYEKRRAIVDAVADAVLRMPPQVAALLIEFRSQLQQSVDHDA